MKQYCVDCSHWTMGDTWGTPQGRDHGYGFTVECKGWCLAKPNKRKRWNYSPATKCLLFDKRKRIGLIMEGQGLPTEEQLETIQNFIEENLGSQEK